MCFEDTPLVPFATCIYLLLRIHKDTRRVAETRHATDTLLACGGRRAYVQFLIVTVDGTRGRVARRCLVEDAVFSHAPLLIVGSLACDARRVDRHGALVHLFEETTSHFFERPSLIM